MPFSKFSATGMTVGSSRLDFNPFRVLSRGRAGACSGLLFFPLRDPGNCLDLPPPLPPLMISIAGIDYARQTFLVLVACTHGLMLVFARPMADQ